MTKYSEKFKLMLVREYQEGKLGYKLLAEKYGMKDSTPIKRWVKVYEKFGVEWYSTIGPWKKAYLEGGAEALDKPKGRPPMSDNAKNKKSKKPLEEKEMTYEQKLERENELLRLEVEYLKKSSDPTFTHFIDNSQHKSAVIKIIIEGGE